MRSGFIVAVVLLAVGCTSEPNKADSTEAPSTAVEFVATTVFVTDGTQFHEPGLGLIFMLPGSFSELDDPELVFLAQSLSPRSVFSIDLDSPKVVNHQARPGETLSDFDFGGGVRAVVVTNAAIEGLPVGISANELLVSNGDWSFSVIMSAGTPNLVALWTAFLRSMTVKPFG